MGAGSLGEASPCTCAEMLLRELAALLDPAGSFSAESDRQLGLT